MSPQPILPPDASQARAYFDDVQEQLGKGNVLLWVTDDLSAFWRDMYPKVKAELSRRRMAEYAAPQGLDVPIQI